MKEAALIAAVLLLALFSVYMVNRIKEAEAKSKEAVSAANQEPRETMNLISEVPQTEEEVMKALQYNDSILTSAMRGIARVRIKMGDTPVQAYEYALLTYIGDMEAGDEKK